jgi:coenzyme F420-reducing hydrogenase delta subunit
LEVTLEALLASSNPEPKVVVFSCNWKGYSGAEMAGLQGLSYPPSARLVRLQCLERLHPGLILRAFELGAAGVLMVGCPPGECEHQSEGAKELFKRTQVLLALLDIDKRRLKLDSVPLGDGRLFAQKVRRFIQRV